MVLKTVKALMEVRAKIAMKSSKALHSGEALTHALYGVALFTEAHAELTFYSVSAFTLGMVALAAFLIGGGSE